MGYLAVICTLLGLVVVGKAWEVVMAVVWRPFALTRWFEKQGVRGPPYRFIRGNVDEIMSMKEAARSSIMDVRFHDFTPRVFPHYLKWSSLYGNTFLFWLTTKPAICIMDVKSVKHILSNKSGFYVKMKPRPSVMAFVGKGLALIDGSDWVRHRRVVNPTFAMDKLKAMAKAMALCTLSMVDKWEEKVVDSGCDQPVSIEISSQFQELTADVISHTAFGKSYAEGKEVFKAQKELTVMAATSGLSVQPPVFEYLPTKKNKMRWALEKKMNGTLMQIIQGRLNNGESDNGNDLLGSLMDACQDCKKPDSAKIGQDLMLGMDEIIEECKTFFFAGHETTSHLLTWTMFLLATHPVWQERLREEVLKELGTSLIPNADDISKLKLVNMVLLEALRLYSPVTVLARHSVKDTKLGGMEIPKNTQITIPVAFIHRSEELWGPDAGEFNPSRFEKGVSRAAKHPNAFIAFSFGSRSCVGQDFAMLEAKIVMSIILRRFSFSLSPNYKHAPVDVITLQPQYGVPIILNYLKTSGGHDALVQSI